MLKINQKERRRFTMKKTNNNGFSLVELSVVVAIMAVLMVVVAPQMLRYVERTRLQKDNSAIAEVANAVKIAMADETINTAVGASTTVTFSNPAGATTGAKTITFDATDELEAELQAMFGPSVATSSNTYRDSTANIVLIIENTSGTVTVEATGWIDEVNGTATTTGSEKVF